VTDPIGELQATYLAALRHGDEAAARAAIAASTMPAPAVVRRRGTERSAALPRGKA